MVMYYKSLHIAAYKYYYPGPSTGSYNYVYAGFLGNRNSIFAEIKSETSAGEVGILLTSDQITGNRGNEYIVEVSLLSWL